MNQATKRQRELDAVGVNCSVCGALRIPTDDEYHVTEDTVGLDLIYVCSECEAPLYNDISLDSQEDLTISDASFMDWYEANA